jgi:hypothetical protein
MTDMHGADDAERRANAVPESSDTDEAFDVYLPFDPDNDPAGATHVAHTRGSRDEFLDLLAGFVDTGSDLSAPLRERGTRTPDRMRFALEGLGPARVESVEEL